MAIISLDAKIVNKRSTVAAEVPTVAPSNDHTDGTWDNLDIYSGEFFINEPDDKLYIRIANNIREINLGAGADTIYTADGSTDNRIVTINPGNTLRFDIAASSTTRFFVGRDTTVANNPIHFAAPNAGGIWVEGFNSSDQSALRVYNAGRTITSLRCHNNGNVYISPEIGITTRGQVAIGNGTAALTGTRLYVRGGGTTDSSFILQAGNGSDTKKLILSDNGQLGTYAGGAAATNANYGQYNQAINYTYGFGFISSAGVTTNTRILHGGNVSNAVGLEVNFIGAPTGTVKGIRAINYTTASTNNIGLEAAARNGATTSIGLDAFIPGGEGTAPSSYRAAVRATAGSNLSAVSYGLYAEVSYQNAGTNFVDDYTAVRGKAIGTAGAAGSTGHVIGGEFSTTGTAGTGNRIALSVPDTGNNGVVLFGADAGALTTSEALLELAATDKAFLIMRMTAAQAGAITPVNGMMLYVTTTDLKFTAVGFWGYEAGAWVKL